MKNSKQRYVEKKRKEHAKVLQIPKFYHFMKY